jgi:hypothetical protein
MIPITNYFQPIQPDWSDEEETAAPNTPSKLCAACDEPTSKAYAIVLDTGLLQNNMSRSNTPTPTASTRSSTPRSDIVCSPICWSRLNRADTPRPTFNSQLLAAVKARIEAQSAFKEEDGYTSPDDQPKKL